MKIFKFGGASVKSDTAIRNVGQIIKRFPHHKLLIVVSAIDKTTNALEEVVYQNLLGKPYEALLDSIVAFHSSIAQKLFDHSHPIQHYLDEWRSLVINQLRQSYTRDEMYDQVVSMGEVLSSKIVYEALKQENITITWIDAREYIVTDQNYRDASVHWEETKKRIKNIEKTLESSIVITQGFIGRADNGKTTTLGREGSDFSAAIFGSCLKAESVTIWKDVPGVMNADPKKLKAAVTFEELPFQEAAEMTYYGASVIHPKTIKPLANALIPLYVRSFDQPDQPGTVIHECHVDQLPPLIVIKENQCLISCKVTDYTFIDEQQLSSIFGALSSRKIKINVMQNSAISFSFCVDFREDKVVGLINELSNNFEVYYNANLTLITIKNYDQKTYDEYRNRPGIILEQSSRSTLQLLIK
ncbi:MAG: aspartate kinase [Flammeovirgaceae bacterium]|nr:aspartate kinase [Flammeovirgaceae bacterium]